MMTVDRIKLAYRVYLPLYFILASIQYTSEFIFLWSMDNSSGEPKAFQDTELVVAFSSGKFLLTSALAFAALSFAMELKNIIRAAAEQGR